MTIGALVAATALLLVASEASAQSVRRNSPACPNSGYLSGRWYCDLTKVMPRRIAKPRGYAPEYFPPTYYPPSYHHDR